MPEHKMYRTEMFIPQGLTAPTIHVAALWVRPTCGLQFAPEIG